MTVRSDTVARARRLKQIEHELCEAAGLRTDALSPADKFRVEHTALLTLQGEFLRARVLSGGTIGTDALLRINEAIRSVLPAKPVKLEIEYVSPPELCAKCKAELDKPPELPPRELVEALPNPPSQPLPIPFSGDQSVRVRRPET